MKYYKKAFRVEFLSFLKKEKENNLKKKYWVGLNFGRRVYNSYI